MLPFALGAVVGAIAVTAIAGSKLGKKVSKEGAKLIDNLDDRISRLAKQVNEDNELVEKLKEAKGKEGEAKPKPKKRAFVLTPEEKRARKAKQARLYYAKNREKILAQNKERQAGKEKKTYPSRQKRIDKIKNIEIK